MKCKYYIKIKKIIGSPETKLLDNSPLKTVYFDGCCKENIIKEFIHGCKGNKCECIYTNISIEAKRHKKKQTNRQWIENLNNHELSMFLCSNYFNNIKMKNNFDLDIWLDNLSVKGETYE